MALAAEIQSLRDRVLADLNAAHDYYTDTKIGWRIVRQFIAAGRYKDGQRIDIPEHYHREIWELLRKVVTDISNAAITKVP